MTNEPALSLLRRARAEGYDVFIMPKGGPVEGRAWWSDGPRIDIFGNVHSVEGARVLAHEMAHHELNHTTLWTSLPEWRREYDAERRALDTLTEYYPEPVIYELEQQARDYVREPIQLMLDEGIHVHGEVDAGVWAGCDVSLEDVLNGW